MPMRPHGSAEQLESRRRKAMDLLGQDLSLNEVARRLGCHASSVMRWRECVRRDGQLGLKARPTPGRPPRLSTPRKQRLVRLLLKGPAAFGYATQIWTTKRIAQLIRRTFSVSYHPAHVGRLMHSLGWSHQKPERRALERDESFIEQWKSTRWPRVKGGLRGWAPTSFSSTNPASS
jgi:transposase